MKRLLLLTAIASLVATAAHAQATDASGVPLISRPGAAPAAASAPAPPAGAARRPPLSPAQQADRQTKRLTQALGLSADQQAKVYQITLAERQNELAAQQQLQATGTQRGLGRAKKAGRAQASDQLRGVLTPDQYGRYQQLLAQRKQGKGHRGRQPPASPMGGPLD